ncbi:hypothetical protein [Streptomyces sp. NRRL WC-3742]|uniref:hypothetical protein n=1 Tax=Streptomyces sp. NRRL WC-3742 TaxID=1463934 RepID=UPI0004CB348D|nr:hypothetical protein [Streptomyces sp. NRRL WC-3742]
MPTDQPGSAESDDLADLRARLGAVEAHAGRLALAPPPRRHLGRASLATVLILLACLLTPLSAVALWAKSEIDDSGRYLATVEPLAKDPVVKAAVVDRVTAEIMRQIPVDSLVDAVAPADQPLLRTLLGQLGQTLASGLSGFVRTEVQQLVDSDAFAALWRQVNLDAHAAIEKMLTGQGGGAVEIRNDTVVLDLAPVIARVKTDLVDRGFAPASKIPEVHTSYTLVQSDAIPRVRTGVRLLDLAGFWVPVLAVACAVGGVLAAVRRRRAAVTAALGMAAGALLLGAGLSVFRALYLDRLPAGVDQAAAQAVYDALVRYLRSAVRVIVALGVVVALGAWITGGGRWARAVRRGWRETLGALRGLGGRAGLRLGPVGGFVHRWKVVLSWAAVAGAALAFVLWSYPTVLVTLCLALVLVAVLALLELLDAPERPAGASP